MDTYWYCGVLTYRARIAALPDGGRRVAGLPRATAMTRESIPEIYTQIDQSVLTVHPSANGSNHTSLAAKSELVKKRSAGEARRSPCGERRGQQPHEGSA